MPVPSKMFGKEPLYWDDSEILGKVSENCSSRMYLSSIEIPSGPTVKNAKRGIQATQHVGVFRICYALQRLTGEVVEEEPQ